jgi:protein SCO1/2
MTTNKKSNKYNKMAILAIILVMPGLLFYFLQQKAENRYQSLPILGPKTLSGTFHSKRGVQIPDTLFHQVTPFSLLNEDGELINFPIDQESISIVNFFYTHCDTFCQEVNNGMSRLAHIFAKNEIIKFYSLSVDSSDTSGLLKEYAKQFNKENTYWQFLSGKDQKVLEISRSEFLLDALVDTTKHDSFIISPYLVLLDSKQRIRGYYDGSESKQIDQLIDEIKLLVTEELRNKKLY